MLILPVVKTLLLNKCFFGKAYVHDVEGCPKGEDSVYLTPTSKDPYDPFKLNVKMNGKNIIIKS